MGGIEFWVTVTELELGRFKLKYFMPRKVIIVTAAQVTLIQTDRRIIDSMVRTKNNYT